MVLKTLNIALVIAAAAVFAAGLLSYWREVPLSFVHLEYPSGRTWWHNGKVVYSTSRLLVYDVKFASGQLRAEFFLRPHPVPRRHCCTMYLGRWKRGPIAFEGYFMDTESGGRLSLPLWVVGTPLLIPSATGFVTGFLCRLWRRHRRRKQNLCVRCGYPLIGLPEPRCPECGTRFTPRVGVAGTAGSNQQASA